MINPEDIPKLKSRDEITKLADQLRPSRKIVTTNGAFDILHPGHVHSLQTARSYGDVLIIGLNSDASIKRLKGQSRPILNQYGRAYMLGALDCVNFVTIFDEDDPRELLKIIKPHFHVKSRTGYKGIEEEVVRAGGGQVILIDDLPGYSTTSILERLRS
jgi:rfaE bifunctional protein nucleotidyltransferase chain/domain